MSLICPLGLRQPETTGVLNDRQVGVERGGGGGGGVERRGRIRGGMPGPACPISMSAERSKYFGT